MTGETTVPGFPTEIVPAITLRGPSVTDPRTLDRAQSRAPSLQKTGAAENEIIRVIYGKPRLGGQVANILNQSSQYWVFDIVWGWGPIDSVVSTTISDSATLPTGTTVTHHDGTQVAVDSVLQAAFAANGYTFNDVRPNIAYSVYKIPTAAIDSVPTFEAVIKGRKIYDPRGPTTAWSDNPALCLADFITNTDYGLGASIDWTSVATAANRCDELVGSPQEKRNLLNLVLDSARLGEEWVEVLRTYAECWVVQTAGTYTLIPDAPAASVYSFDHSTGNIIDLPRLGKAKLLDVPTVVIATYTNTATIPYRDAKAFAYASGAKEGTVPWRESQVSLPAVHRYSEAYRQAVQRLNKLTINDLSGSIVGADEALQLNLGDVVTVTHPMGLTAKPMRIAAIDSRSPGRPAFELDEYNAAAYSSEVVTAADYPDTLLPSPGSPPTVSGLDSAEVLAQGRDGMFASAIKAWWTAPAYPFVLHYLVDIYEGSVTEANRVDQFTTSGTTVITRTLPEGKTYIIAVAVVSKTGATGTQATDGVTLIGKSARPGDVAGITAYCFAGAVRIEIDPGYDLDLTATELRYGPTAGAWESAYLINRVAMPAIVYAAENIPPGNWRIWAKHLDSVRTVEFPNGQESVNAVYQDLVVDTDPTAKTSEFVPAGVTLTNMAAYGPGGWITSFAADTWNATFTSNINSYTNPLVSYHASGVSGLVTDYVDLGALVNTDLSTTLSYVDITGTAQAYLEHSTDHAAWTRINGIAGSAQCRYVRAGVEAPTGATVWVLSKGLIRSSVDATDDFLKVTALNDMVAWMG